jgi:hypothetical protein
LRVEGVAWLAQQIPCGKKVILKCVRKMMRKTKIGLMKNLSNRNAVARACNNVLINENGTVMYNNIWHSRNLSHKSWRDLYSRNHRL